MLHWKSFILAKIVIGSLMIVFTAETVFSQPWDARVNITTSGFLQAGIDPAASDPEKSYLRVGVGNDNYPSIRFGNDENNGLLLYSGKIRLKTGGYCRWEASSSYLGSANNSYPVILYSTASTTVPTFVTEGNRDTGFSPVAGKDSAAVVVGNICAILAEENTGYGWNNNVQVEIAGDMKINHGNIVGNANTRGNDSFAGTANVDSIYNLDFSAGDNFTAAWNYALSDSSCILSAVCVEDYLIVNRAPVEGAGKLKADAGYNWQRQR